MRQKSDALKAGAEQTVRDVRRRARNQYFAEEKIRIVLAGLRGEDNTAELSLENRLLNKSMSGGGESDT